MGFRQTARGKVLSHGVHDIINGTCSLNAALSNLENTENLSLDQQTVERIARMRAFVKRINEAVDYIYEELEKLEK